MYGRTQPQHKGGWKPAKAKNDSFQQGEWHQQIQRIKENTPLEFST